MVRLRAGVFVREEAVVGLRAVVLVREEAEVVRRRVVDVLFFLAVLFLAGMEPPFSIRTHHDDDRILYPASGISYRALPGSIEHQDRAGDRAGLHRAERPGGAGEGTRTPRPSAWEADALPSAQPVLKAHLQCDDRNCSPVQMSVGATSKSCDVASTTIAGGTPTADSQ